jgi:hypothetical protein
MLLPDVEIEKYEIGISSKGVTYIPDFMIIGQSIQRFGGAPTG